MNINKYKPGDYIGYWRGYEVHMRDEYYFNRNEVFIVKRDGEYRLVHDSEVVAVVKTNGDIKNIKAPYRYIPKKRDCDTESHVKEDFSAYSTVVDEFFEKLKDVKF